MICLAVVVSLFGVANLIVASLRGYLLNFITPSLSLIVVSIKLILDNQKAAKFFEDVRKAARKLHFSFATPTMTQYDKSITNCIVAGSK